MFAWAIEKTGILAWLVFLGFPTLMVLFWTVGMTWPITAARRKVRFVVAFLFFQFFPAALGFWIGMVGLWSE